MKKILSLLLALMQLVSLAGCRVTPATHDAPPANAGTQIEDSAELPKQDEISDIPSDTEINTNEEISTDENAEDTTVQKPSDPETESKPDSDSKPDSKPDPKPEEVPAGSETIFPLCGSEYWQSLSNGSQCGQHPPF